MGALTCVTLILGQPVLVYIHSYNKYNTKHTSGWIVPVKGTAYPLNSSTFHITTESIIGGSDTVQFNLISDSNVRITFISWKFQDWGYTILYCTPLNGSLKFPVTPPTGVNKTWEITFTTEDVKIKCNTLQVLHFIFNNTRADNCTSNVKGKIATGIKFRGNNRDTATKTFKSDQVGK